MDEYRFTPDDEIEAGGPMWASPEEEVVFRRVRDLLMVLRDRGTGVTIRPIQPGMRVGGFGSDEEYAVEGWEVGYIDGNGGGELAAAASLDQAVQAAIAETTATR